MKHIVENLDTHLKKKVSTPLYSIGFIRWQEDGLISRNCEINTDYMFTNNQQVKYLINLWMKFYQGT